MDIATRQWRFEIRVFLLLDELPSKANESHLPSLKHIFNFEISEEGSRGRPAQWKCRFSNAYNPGINLDSLWCFSETQKNLVPQAVTSGPPFRSPPTPTRHSLAIVYTVAIILYLAKFIIIYKLNTCNEMSALWCLSVFFKPGWPILPRYYVY